MFNKLITRIKESDKGRESPQPPPSPSNVPHATGDQTAEGFLCPTCMQSFASPEDLQTHYQSFHAQSERHVCPICKNEFPTSDQLQIHYTADHISSGVDRSDLQVLKQEVAELQTTLKEERWYSNELKREVSRLSGAVNKEYSEEQVLLKQQLRALEESKSLLTSEVVLLRKQLGEAVEMHTSMKQQKESIEQKTASLAAEKVTLQACADEERGLRKSLEIQLVEVQDLNSNLEAQLQQRPEADDVRVLRQELVQVQTLMDRMTRERETERDMLQQENKAFHIKVQELQQQLCDREEELTQAPSVVQIEQLKNELDEKEKALLHLKVAYQEICQKKQDHLEKLEQLQHLIEQKDDSLSNFTKTTKDLQDMKDALEQQITEINENTRVTKVQLDLQLQELKVALQNKEAELAEKDQWLLNQQENSSTELLQKQQQFSDLQLCCNGLEMSLQEREAKLNDLQKQLSALQTHYQDQTTATDEIKAQLWEVQSELEKEVRARKAGEERLEEYENIVQQHKATIQRLEKERSDLYVKIEAGEGANTAIQQLQLEKTNLLEKCAEQKNLNEEQTKESTAKLEALHHTLQETKAQLQNSSEKITKLQTSLAETTTALSSCKEKCQQLEKALQIKSEALVAAESTWNKQKMEFENRLRNQQSAMAAKVADAERAGNRIKQLNEELTSSQTSIQELDSKLAEQNMVCLRLTKTVQDLDVELKQAKSQIADKTAALEDQQASFIEAQQEINNLKEKMNKKEVEFSEQLKNVDNIKASVQQELDLFKSEKSVAENLVKELRNIIFHKCQNYMSSAATLKKEMLEVKKYHGLLLDMFNSESLLLKKECQKVSSLFTEMRNTIVIKSKAEDLLKSKVKELEESRQQQEANLKILRGTVQEKIGHITEQDDCINKLSCQLDFKETQLTALGMELEKATKDVEQCLRRFQQSEANLEQLQRDYTATSTKLTDTESVLADTQQQLTVAIAAHQKILQELTENKKLGEGLQQALDEKVQLNAELDEQSKDLNIQLAAAIDGLNDAVLQKASLETELFGVQKSLSELEEKCSGLEVNIVDIENKHIQEKDILAKQISKLQDAQELLIGQKLEIQNELSAVKDQLKTEISNYENTCEALKNTVTQHQQHLAEKSAQLMALQESKNAVEQESDQAKARYEMQMGTLQENLATLRADLVNHQDKVQVLEKKENDLLGDKLELEAKLENALDERRALLERCLNSEGECEKLRTLTIELRRKLDDALSALHELGRENQTLQIETAKHVNRKWADDSEVHNCTRCQKLFSVTVRKHHCRNCGNIYCNECSTKNAMIAAYKKPVRVCDGCYDELITK